MAETIRVEPTPIQRNLFDVAVELTQLYFETKRPDSVTEIQEVYTEFYSTVVSVRRNS